VLFTMTGSVALAIKSLIMNLLTLSAAFGILVLIFQDGRLQSLLGYTATGSLEQTNMIILFIIAFGLSTDYGVFLLARIKEAHDAGASDKVAVATGLERSGRVVSAAALLFCAAVGSLAASSVASLKEFGIGAALAVMIDATIVRALLVPALMALLGRANWWAPRPLRRLVARSSAHPTNAVRERITAVHPR
jgi:RND superfamily putative drug exporter